MLSYNSDQLSNDWKKKPETTQFLIYLALANPDVQKLGKFKWSKQKAWPACPFPGTPSWEAEWECWVAAEVSTQSCLMGGWVTLSQEGEKGKKGWIGLRMVENCTYCTAKATLLPHLSFSTDIGKTESSEEERSQGTQLLASITQPLVTASSICFVLLFETRSLHGSVESIPRDGFSFEWVCICILAHMGCFLWLC